MSHFSVMVVTNTDDKQELEAALLPFHEFECTGDDNQYVQAFDITEEARTEFAADTTRVYRSPDGALHDAYDDRFYRNPTPDERKRIGPVGGTGGGGGLLWTSKDWGDGLGYRTKVHFIPEGYEDLRVPTATRMSFLTWASDYYGRSVLRLDDHPTDDHKYGYVLVNEDGEVVKIVKRTNPNKQWDWWTIGGRYSGQLVVRGRKCDHARFGNIDMDEMRQAKRERRAAAVAEARAELAAGEYDEGMICFLYGAQIFDDDYISRDQSWTFAVLKDGAWLQRGEMGWWGMVSNEERPEDWDEAYRIVLASIRPDQHVWIVDCHI